MRQVKQVRVLRFEGGPTSAMSLDKITDSIDQWAHDNSVQLLDVSLTSAHPPALFASVIYQTPHKHKTRKA